MSSYKESILNAIASGIHTRMELCEVLNVGYATISKIISDLLKEDKIFSYAINNEEIYTLKVSERWRLFSFTYTNLFIENIYPFIFTSDNEEFEFGTFSVYTTKINTNETIGLIQCDKDMNEMCNLIDSQLSLRYYLPTLVIPIPSSTSIKTLKNVQYFIENTLPIYLITNNFELLPFVLPKKCRVIQFTDKLCIKLKEIIQLHPMKTTEEIAIMVKLNKETVRKRLKILERKNEIKGTRKGRISQTVWRINEGNV